MAQSAVGSYSNPLKKFKFVDPTWVDELLANQNIKAGLSR